MAKQPEVIQLAIQGKLEELDRNLGTPEFFQNARCKDADPTLFFAESNSKVAQAKKCAQCALSDKCALIGHGRMPKRASMAP